MASQTVKSEANASAVIVIPPPANDNRRWEITISISWSETPTAEALLTVVNTDDELEIERFYAGAIERAGVVCRTVKANKGLTITLGAAGDGIRTTMTVDYREIPAPAKPRSQMTRI